MIQLLTYDLVELLNTCNSYDGHFQAWLIGVKTLAFALCAYMLASGEPVSDHVARRLLLV